MGSPIDNLLLNLKLQLLALPALARWGLLTFAGIVVLKESVEIGWRLYQGRVDRAAALRSGEAPAALPAPDPFAERPIPAVERERDMIPRTPRPGA